MDAIASLERALAAAGLPCAVIGAHAVNAWLEPRFTADLDVAVTAGPAEVARLKEALAAEGYVLDAEQGADLSSGPDFLRFRSSDSVISLEVQLAKTDFQRDVIARARSSSGLPVATVEDLIVMKLIADRPKDRVDLAGLLQLPGIDWAYVERWAAEWDVAERLREARSAAR